MSFWMEIDAYSGYAVLFALGVAREYWIRIRAYVFMDPMAIKYLARERWSTGWVEFYLQHMYRLYLDCFSRPTASGSDACVDVVKRERPGGFMSPMYDLKFTDQVHKCVNLGSYNYLGFGGVDEYCTPAAHASFLEHGFSASGTRTEGGTLQVHRDLEREVAAYLGKEDALVLGMGFATNSTVLPALFEAGGKGILVLSDELNHRSIVEGVRLSGATVRAFAHNSMEALESALERAMVEKQPNGQPWRKVFIAIEGIYSMEGDFCRLREIVSLKNRYKAYLYLDEAHSIGAVGATGRGVTELFGVPSSEVEVMMGTFTKSFGSAGGYVASSREVIDALRQGAPGSIFASAMAPPCAAQALAALKVITGEIGGKTGAEKLASIRDNSNYFRTRLAEEGFKILGDTDSPIIPVMLHHPQKMAAFSRKCLDRGIAVVVVGNPAVPVLYERVRFCISAAHTRPQLEKVMTDLTEIASKVGVLYEKYVDQEEKTSRAAQKAEYDALLRTAKLELTATGKNLADSAAGWSPEPLAPSAHQRSKHCAAVLAAVTTVEPHSRLDFRLFDPLGYVSKPALVAQQAAEKAMNHYGFGSCGPRGFYGGTKAHFELEAALARFMGTDSAIVYSAGVATASSVLPALIQSGDHVIIDTEAHLGLRTGLRLCKAKITWVPHNDVAAIEAALCGGSGSGSDSASTGPAAGRTFIVMEALSQRTGCLAPLPELVALKEKHGALLLLDETLSIGALGKHGRGLCEHHGIEITRVDAIIGSLEHALANVGGFCVGRRGLVEHQRLAGAGYCFSASAPPSACASAAATIGELEGENGVVRLARLQSNAPTLHKTLQTAISASDGTAKPALVLVSAPESYAQHLKWVGATEDAEARLLRVAEHCAAQSNVRVQVCLPGLCAAEDAFGARLGAPAAAVSKLGIRICTSAEHTVDELAAVGKALRAALCSVGLVA